MAVFYEGNVRLGSSIRFAVEALGSSFEGELANGKVRLLLPIMGADGGLEKPAELAERASRLDLNDTWGAGGTYSTADPNGPPLSLVDSAVGLEYSTDYVASEELCKVAWRLGAELNQWLALVTDWLELWTDQPLVLDQNVPYESRGHLWETTRNGNSTSGWSPSMRAYFGGMAVSSQMMRSACERASRQESVPDDWQIFLRSKRWNTDRLKLIDAATAAEVAIERRLYTELRLRSTLDEPSIEALLTNAPGIVEKLRTLEALLPPAHSQVRRVAGQIAGPRNRASHAGTAPSEEETKIAIQAASDILTTYSPMPMPTD